MKKFPSKCKSESIIMALLESIIIGTHVFGIVNNNSPVNIISVKWNGTNALIATYRNANGT